MLSALFLSAALQFLQRENLSEKASFLEFRELFAAASWHNLHFIGVCECYFFAPTITDSILLHAPKTIFLLGTGEIGKVEICWKMKDFSF